MGKSAQIYAQELSTYDHGLPLWTPEPADSHGIHIGDVGYIDEDGQFHRLFNITVDANHPLNKYGVPEDFAPLSFPPRLLHNKDKQLPPGVITSKTVQKREIEATAGTNAAFVTGGANSRISYNFDCSKDQGAILVLSDAAKKAWYEYATTQETLECDPEDIIFVRGTVKTRGSWALAAYWENSSHMSISFNGQAGEIADTTLKWSIVKSTSAHFEHRIGSSSERAPGLKTTTDNRESPVQENQLEISAEGDQSLRCTADCDGPDSHCVFLQCLKIKYRFWSFQKKITAAAGPSGFPNGEDQSGPQPVSLAQDDGEQNETDYMIESLPRHFKLRTPIDDILDYILEFSNAKVAIAGDEDVAGFCKLQGRKTSLGFAQYLREAMPKIDLDNNGIGRLSLQTVIASTNAETRQPRNIYLKRNRGLGWIISLIIGILMGMVALKIMSNDSKQPIADGAAPVHLASLTPANAPTRVESRSLVEAPGAQLVELFDQNLWASGISLDIRLAETAVPELIMLVRASDLRNKETLAGYLTQFMADAEKTSRSLQEMSSRVASVVDDIIAVNGYVARAVEARQTNIELFHAAYMSFTSQSSSHAVFIIEAMSAVESQIQHIVFEAEVSLRELAKLEEQLHTISLFIADENKAIVENRERPRDSLWSMLSAKEGLAHMTDQRFLLSNVGQYQDRAAVHVKAALHILRDIRGDMEGLREHIAAAKLVGNGIPVDIQRKSIMSGLAQMHGYLQKMKELEGGTVRSGLASDAGESDS